VRIGASVRNEPSLNSRNLFRRISRNATRLSEYRPDQLRVKAKPRRTRRFAALTRTFNSGRIFHYPGMSMKKQKRKQSSSVFIVAVRMNRSRNPAVKATRAHPSASVVIITILKSLPIELKDTLAKHCFN